MARVNIFDAALMLPPMLMTCEYLGCTDSTAVFDSTANVDSNAQILMTTLILQLT